VYDWQLKREYLQIKINQNSAYKITISQLSLSNKKQFTYMKTYSEIKAKELEVTKDLSTKWVKTRLKSAKISKYIIDEKVFLLHLYWLFYLF